jgi:hypothetical protein
MKGHSLSEYLCVMVLRKGKDIEVEWQVTIGRLKAPRHEHVWAFLCGGKGRERER